MAAREGQVTICCDCKPRPCILPTEECSLTLMLRDSAEELQTHTTQSPSQKMEQYLPIIYMK